MPDNDEVARALTALTAPAAEPTAEVLESVHDGLLTVPVDTPRLTVGAGAVDPFPQLAIRRRAAF